MATTVENLPSPSHNVSMISSSSEVRPTTPRRKKSRKSLLHQEKLLLKHGWTFYYDERPIKGMEVTDYEKSMKVIGTFQTVQVSSLQDLASDYFPR
jgi:hypothetical protein